MPAWSSTRRHLVVVLLGAVLATSALQTIARAAPTELFFSEYIEGTSNNKALEIFNGTGAAVDLTTGGYNVQMFFNGSPTAGLTINLNGTVADGDVFVVAQSLADPVILAQADQTNGAGWFNGNDAVVLRKGTTFIDVIGQVGLDPGTQWGTGDASTMDNTLRRKGTIEAGDPNGADAFDPALEWDGFATNTFDGLGSHQFGQPVIVDCGPTLVTDEGTAATTTVTGTDADDTVIDLSITSVVPDPSPGTITRTAFTPAAGEGGTASADITADAAVPAGSYSVTVTGTNDQGGTGSCVLTVQVLAPPIAIGEIQGSGSSSPFVGQQVRTTGVVTVILGSGLFIQDPVGDADPATSDGLFVFTGSSLARTVAPGDQVSVVGTVTEFRSSTRPRDLTLTELTSVTLTKTGVAALPYPEGIVDRPDEVISPDGIVAFEQLEGMLVSIATPLVTGPTNDFGELVVVASGDASNATAAGNLLLRSLGGDLVDYNPERVLVDDEARVPGGSGSGTRINDPMVLAEVGAEASADIVGAMDYQFSEYRVQASHVVADVVPGAVPSSPASDLREAAPYESRIATFNVENLFDCTDDPGKEDDHPSCSSSNLADLDTKLTKLSSALTQELDTPELLIVEEVEKVEVLTGDANGFVPGTSMPALLPRVAGTAYEAVSFDASDIRGIEVAFVYDTARVTLHDTYLSTDVLPDPEGLFDGSGVYGAGREPLVGVFTVDDIDLTIVGLHLKSKGGPQFGVPTTEQPAGDDPLYGEVQPPIRWTEELRHKQADYVRALVDLLLTNDPGSEILVGGDLNDFEFPEPGEGADTIGRIEASATDPLSDLVRMTPADDRYSFGFVGNSQALDHMLVTGGLLTLHSEQRFAHFNTDFPTAFSEDPAVTLRSSDHDPLVGYFCSDATPPTLTVSVSPTVLVPPNHKYRTVQATVTASDDEDPSIAVVLVSVTSNEPDDAPGPADGKTINDIVVVDDDTFLLRAERSELGTGRIYTITYSVTDACGNQTTKSATVTVPVRR